MTVTKFATLLSGDTMPIIGLGTGMIRTEAEIETTLDTAFQQGYRHIDTAYLYQNEVLIGRVLKKWFASGKLKREDIFVTTKLPMAGVHKDRVEMFMKKSLENLQLDYVDLYLIHWPIGTKYVEGEPPGSKLEIDVFDLVEVWKKMEEQVDAGRAKNIGLSNFNQRQIERILKAARIKPSCLQIELHVDLQQRDLVSFCQKNNIIVVAYSPLAAPGSDRGLSGPAVINNETITKIAAKYKKTNGQVMLRYLLQKNIVVIPKSSNPARLKENLDLFNFDIDSEDMRALDGLEAGESARTITVRTIPGYVDHPEYPFPK